MSECGEREGEGVHTLGLGTKAGEWSVKHHLAWQYV